MGKIDWTELAIVDFVTHSMSYKTFLRHDTGCLIMKDQKYELIAQAKKHHWRLRQVAKFH